jgi:type I restriction enzyme S subunit
VGYKVVLSGDLVVNTMLAWNGSMGSSPVDGIVSPAYAVYRPLAGVDPRYFQYLLTTPLLKGVIRAWSSGIQDSRLRLYPNKFFQIALPLPPFVEQMRISSYLDAQLKGSDAAAAVIMTEIAHLKEYRTRLISDVVTGKLDVRDEAAKLPEIDPMELANVAVGENGDDEEATDDD